MTQEQLADTVAERMLGNQALEIYYVRLNGYVSGRCRGCGHRGLFDLVSTEQIGEYLYLRTVPHVCGGDVRVFRLSARVLPESEKGSAKISPLASGERWAVTVGNGGARWG